MSYVLNPVLLFYYDLYYVRPKHGKNRFVGNWELCGMYIHTGRSQSGKDRGASLCSFDLFPTIDNLVKMGLPQAVVCDGTSGTLLSRDHSAKIKNTTAPPKNTTISDLFTRTLWQEN
jgi:hypothetical protein